ncbi:MAG: lysophospholipase [Rhizobiales bacterium]|nr:lysophospholipase [Hyphomicrobiales bacterium]MBA70012.1 lysophospholipase [Hyphomicrobiales bacterium]|tara:strand:+ start:216 stop:650 length:435 start_codon:yes stop_codon:yes gene_type:complete
MALHLIKLCVGADSVEDLESWIAHRTDMQRAAGQPLRQVHVTRMQPKRGDELLDGGSLYWVIKGNVQARQRLVGIEPFTDNEGIARCRLVLDPVLVHTRWQPKRPFQGWRYLKDEDKPADLGADEGVEELPPELRGELASLGLL